MVLFRHTMTYQHPPLLERSHTPPIGEKLEQAASYKLSLQKFIKEQRDRTQLSGMVFTVVAPTAAEVACGAAGSVFDTVNAPVTPAGTIEGRVT